MGRGIRFAVHAMTFLFVAGLASARQTTRESVDSNGKEADNSSNGPAVSSDGGVVAFSSYADNLIANDTNATSDIFVRDRATGAVTRVSVKSNGKEGNDYSFSPSLSGDGMTVAFASYARNLVNGDTNKVADVFVHDRATATTTRVSVDSNGKEADSDSYQPSISADGMIVAFASNATNLVAGDLNKVEDIFVHDRNTGVTTRVSVDGNGVEGNGYSYSPSISADGRFVTFASDATNLVPNDTNNATDVFVYDLLNGTIERASVDSNGAEADAGSYEPTISGDGSRVVFTSYADNLIASDTNVTSDCFVHDRNSGATFRVSIASDGSEANDFSFIPHITADGGVVAFGSGATNLVANDTNKTYDVFRHDIATGATTRENVDSAGNEANDGSKELTISGNGQFTAFSSYADNLVSGDTNGTSDIFLHESCVPATWSIYGVGWPGTLGAPYVAPNSNPVLGSSITLTVSNSVGVNTQGLLIVGLAQASIPTSKGGTLLVVPLIYVPLFVPAAGIGLTGSVPSDSAFCGLEVDMQALELDSGASNGVSFTPGLQLIFGT